MNIESLEASRLKTMNKVSLGDMWLVIECWWRGTVIAAHEGDDMFCGNMIISSSEKTKLPTCVLLLIFYWKLNLLFKDIVALSSLAKLDVTVEHI